MLQGGRERRLRLGDLQVVVAPGGRAPFGLDAVVLEDDTYRVLAAPPDITPSNEELRDILRAVRDSVPAMPGTVVAGRGVPLALHGIVHDLDCEPSWSDLWVEQALHSVLLAVRERRIRAIGLPLLGTVHGGMTVERSIELLLQALQAGGSGPLERVWVLAPQSRLDEAAANLGAGGPTRSLSL